MPPSRMPAKALLLPSVLLGSEALVLPKNDELEHFCNISQSIHLVFLAPEHGMVEETSEMPTRFRLSSMLVCPRQAPSFA